MHACDALYPPWLLPQPLRLEVRGEKPHYHGPLRLLAGPHGWRPAGGTTVRKAWRCATTSLPAAMRPGWCGCTASGCNRNAVRWFLQGLYA